MQLVLVRPCPTSGLDLRGYLWTQRGRDRWAQALRATSVAGLAQRSRDVVAEVPESERGRSEVLEAAVDRHCRSVAGTGPVEERQDVRCPLLQRSTELPGSSRSESSNASGTRAGRRSSET